MEIEIAISAINLFALALLASVDMAFSQLSDCEPPKAVFRS